jgi:hypothetical protein
MCPSHHKSVRNFFKAYFNTFLVNSSSILNNSNIFDEETAQIASLEGRRVRRNKKITKSASTFSLNRKPEYYKKMEVVENIYKKDAVKLNDANFKLLQNNHSGSIWKDSGIRLTVQEHKQYKFSLKAYEFLIGTVDSRSKYLPLHMTLTEPHMKCPLHKF